MNPPRISPGDETVELSTAPTQSHPLHWRAQLAQLVATLQTWPWLETLHTLRGRFREDRLGITASSLTFTTLISLVPLVTVMLAVFSAFPMFAEFQLSVQTYFLQSLVPDSIAKPVLAALTQFAAKASRLGGVGLAFLISTALALMLTIDRTLNGIWRVLRPRPIAQRVLVYWAAATLGPLVLGISLSLISYAVSASSGLIEALPGGVKLLLSLTEFGLFAFGVAALFRFVPNTDVRWRHALAGGVFVALAFQLGKLCLGWYLATISTYSVVYGAFATLPIFLVWLYLGWVIVLMGAVIAAYAPSLQMRQVRSPRAPGHRFELALALLRELQTARTGEARGLDAQQLSERLHIDPLRIEPLLELLVALDWVGRLDEATCPRYLLLGDPAGLPVRPLVLHLLLAPSGAVDEFWRRADLDRIKLSEVLGPG